MVFPDDSYHWFRKMYLEQRLAQYPPPPPTCCWGNAERHECISRYGEEYRQLWCSVINTQTFVDSCMYIQQQISDAGTKLADSPNRTVDELKIPGFIDYPQHINEILPEVLVAGLYSHSRMTIIYGSSVPTRDKYLTTRVNVRRFFCLSLSRYDVDFVRRELDLIQVNLAYIIALAQPTPELRDQEKESPEYFPPPPPRAPI